MGQRDKRETRELSRELRRDKSKKYLSFGLSVFKAVSGGIIALFGMFAAITVSLLTRNFGTIQGNSLYYFVEFFMLSITTTGGLLLYNGITTITLNARYEIIKKETQFQNRVALKRLSEKTGRSLTSVVADLNRLIDKKVYPDGFVDIENAEFAVVKDTKPAPMRHDGEMVLDVHQRPSFLPLIAIPAIFVGYEAFFGFYAWYDFAIAGATILVTLLAAYKSRRKVDVVFQKPHKALPQAEVKEIATGNSELDIFLNKAMDNISDLNQLTMKISNPKVNASVSEMLDITRQIFVFVEKHPEKIRQIRKFMNYNLPTTIRLLTTYHELSEQDIKGENITDCMTQIENAMSGIVDTFKVEADNLYSDKATEISVDIDMMLAFMRQRGINIEDKDYTNNDKAEG